MKKPLLTFFISLIIFSFFLTSTSVFAQGWIQQNSNSSISFRTVYFIDQNIGYASGMSTSRTDIFKTNDGGNNWELIYSQQGLPIFSLSFINANTGMGVGANGVNLRTTNGGNSWNQVLFSSSNLNSISFLDQNYGWVGGNYNFSSATIFKSTNGGQSWNSVSNNLIGNISIIHFLNINVGVAAMGIYIYKTTNGGSNWTPGFTSSNYKDINSLNMINSDIGFAVGEYGLILKTTDGGSNWDYQISGSADDLESVDFIDANTGWIAGDDATILKTTNGGANWGIQNTNLGLEFGLFDVQFLNANTGWAVGEDGKIIKTTSGGSVNVTLTGTELPDEFKIFNNYPNPFNPVTKIKFQIPTSTKVKLSVFNSNGLHVATLLNSNLIAGSYEAEFNANNLPSGIYFCKIEAGDFNHSIKMILIK
ncbi:MAG TPA: YCF48-related protein [Ignavibacteria bacterium]|nr:YCF48-related protein [Ignavibacteria bacterium]